MLTAVHTSSQSPASINEDDIQLPPEAPGNCSKRLQVGIFSIFKLLALFGLLNSTSAN